MATPAKRLFRLPTRPTRRPDWAQGPAAIPPAGPLDQDTYWRWRLALLRANTTENGTAPTLIAQAYAEMAEADSALSLLEEAVEERDGQIVFLGVQPTWDNIRGTPGFERLSDRLGIVTHGT